MTPPSHLSTLSQVCPAYTRPCVIIEVSYYLYNKRPTGRTGLRLNSFVGPVLVTEVLLTHNPHEERYDELRILVPQTETLKKNVKFYFYFSTVYLFLHLQINLSFTLIRRV